MSVGRQTNLANLGDAPANFIVRPFVPQLAVLQRAALFITHGGINSVHEGLHYGVPLLVIPQQFEQLLNARSVTAQGAGLILDRKRVTAPGLREAVAQILTTPSYTERAADLQAILRNTGGYLHAADELLAYMDKR
jgi:MGT family glycosyltransferase